MECKQNSRMPLRGDDDDGKKERNAMWLCERKPEQEGDGNERRKNVNNNEFIQFFACLLLLSMSIVMTLFLFTDVAA
jgi:hypothetical protein